MNISLKKIFNLKLNRYTPFLIIATALILYAHYHYQYRSLMDETYGQNRQTVEQVDRQERQAFLREFEIPGMSANDITIIGPVHVKDQDHNIYFTNEIIKDADLDSFRYFSVPGLSTRNVLSKDKNHLYVGNEIVENADPDSFIYLGQKKVAFFEGNSQTDNNDNAYQNLYYGADKNHIFINYKILEGADRKSFQLLDTYYDRDKDSIFYHGEKLEGSDADSFIFYPLSHQTYTRYENFLPGYAIDKNQAYYNFKPIENVDIASFQLVKGYYAKDKNHVYFQGEIIPLIDPETFIYVNQPLFRHDPTEPIAITLADFMANNTGKKFYLYHDDYKRPDAYKYGYFRDKNSCFSYLNTHIIINETWNCQLNTNTEIPNNSDDQEINE